MFPLLSLFLLFFVPKLKAEAGNYLNNIAASPPSTSSYYSSTSVSEGRLSSSSTGYTRQWGTSSSPSASLSSSATSNRTMHYVDTRISSGVVRGLVSYAGKSPAHVYKGIPMAEPPLGNLRFKKLKPRRPWNIVWNATNYSAACPSNTTRTKSPQEHMAEDCIYMNVYGDAKCKKCKVLLYIHGGGFVYDSAVMFNETQIVQKYASDGVVSF